MRDVADDLGWGDAFEDSDASDAGAESDASASDDDGRTATATTTTTTRDAAASRIASAQATTATTTREGARVGTIGPELAALRAAGRDEGTLHDVALRSVVRVRATVATRRARE